MINEKTKSCPMCGLSVKEDDVFCNNCGASLTDLVEIDSKTTISGEQVVQATTTQQYQSVLVDKTSEPRNIVAIVSMVLGIIALGFSFVWFLCCVSIPFQIAAFITGIIGVIRKKRRYFAVAGLGLAVVAFTMFMLQRFGVFFLY